MSFKFKLRISIIYCNVILYYSACAGNQLPEIFGMLSVDISVLRHISKQRGRQGGTTGGHRYRDTHYLADMQVMSDDVVQCLEETVHPWKSTDGTKILYCRSKKQILM